MSQRLAVGIIPGHGVAGEALRPTFFADWPTYPWFAHEIRAKKKIDLPSDDVTVGYRQHEN